MFDFVNILVLYQTIPFSLFGVRVIQDLHNIFYQGKSFLKREKKRKKEEAEEEIRKIEMKSNSAVLETEDDFERLLFFLTFPLYSADYSFY